MEYRGAGKNENQPNYSLIASEDLINVQIETHKERGRETYLQHTNKGHNSAAVIEIGNIGEPERFTAYCMRSTWPVIHRCQ